MNGGKNVTMIEEYSKGIWLGMLKVEQNKRYIIIDLQCVLTAPVLKITRMQYVLKG